MLKLLLNSVLSISEAYFLKIDILKFYLVIDLKEKQYAFLPADLISKEMIQKIQALEQNT